MNLLACLTAIALPLCERAPVERYATVTVAELRGFHIETVTYVLAVGADGRIVRAQSDLAHLIGRPWAHLKEMLGERRGYTVLEYPVPPGALVNQRKRWLGKLR